MSFTEYFNYFKKDKNNFSNWFPRIKNCGIAVPNSVMIPVPEEVAKAYFMDNQERDLQTITDWVKKAVMPEGEKLMRSTPYIFVKNGTFSDKFTFRNCQCRLLLPEMVTAITEINYSSLMLGAGGISELVLREYIPSNNQKIPCIYDGMPLRTEFRCFYDFDQKKLLYSVNYWDWDYCHDSIARNATDRIVYEAYYPQVEEEYRARLPQVEAMIRTHLKDVDVTGIWSVDILYNAEDDTFYLIDMATAKTSAYWKPDLCEETAN